MSLIKTGPFAHFDCGEDCDMDELAGVRAGDFNEQKPLPTVEQAIEAAVDRIYTLGLLTAKGRYEDIRQHLRIVAAAARFAALKSVARWETDYDATAMLVRDMRADAEADLRREVGDA